MLTQSAQQKLRKELISQGYKKVSSGSERGFTWVNYRKGNEIVEIRRNYFEESKDNWEVIYNTIDEERMTLNISKITGYTEARQLAKLLKCRITYANVLYPASKIKDFMKSGVGGGQRFEIRNKVQCLAILYREDVNQDIFEVRYI